MVVGSTVTQVLMDSDGFCPPTISSKACLALHTAVQKQNFCAWYRSAAKEDIFTHQEKLQT